MADQQTTDIVVEGSKIAGGGGLGFVIAKLLDRVFKKVEVDDEREAKALEGINAKLETVVASLGTLSTDVKLVMQANTTTRADVDKLEVEVKALAREVAELAGAYKALTEQLAK